MKSGKIKYCVGCGIIRTKENTDIMSNGYFRGRCKECFKVYCKEYEKTKKGYLVRTYRNMKSRVEGIQHKKAHLYEGRELLDKKDFYKWSLDQEAFHILHKQWVESEYNIKLSPSIDRIDSTKGYYIGNIRWITHLENSKLGLESRYNKRKI